MIRVDNFTYKIFQNTNNSKYSFIEKLKSQKYCHVPQDNFDYFFDLSFLPIEDLPIFIEDLREKNIVRTKFNNTKSFCFVNMGEGYACDSYFTYLHEIISLLNLKGKVYLTNASYNLCEMYEKFCKRKKIPKLINCFYHSNLFESPNLRMDGQKVYNDTSGKIKLRKLFEKKLFCNFNMRDRGHRYAMIAILHYYNLLEDNFVSSPNGLWDENPYNFHRDWHRMITYPENFFQNHELQADSVHKIESRKSKYPLRIDDRSKYDTAEEAILDSKLCNARKQSLFEIISETHVYGTHFFSEKTFMPIFLKKPFLMYNGYKALESLKKMGYMSFHPIINESYDNIKNDAARCVAIAEELARQKDLRTNQPDLFYMQYKILLRICDYNYKIFIKKSL